MENFILCEKEEVPEVDEEVNSQTPMVDEEIDSEIPVESQIEQIEIISDTHSYSKRFQTNIESVEFKNKSIPDNVEPLTWIKSAVEGVIKMCIEKSNDNDKIGFTISGASFEKGEAWMSFKRASKVKPNDIWESLLGKVFQCNSEGLSRDTFTLKSTIIKMPEGKGRVKRYTNYDEECAARNGIIVIKNKDNSCLPRAIVVAEANINKSSNYKNIKDIRYKQQTIAAQNLVEQSGITIPVNGCGIEEINKFQNFLLNQYKTTVYEYTSKTIIFEGQCENPLPKKINLLYHRNHFNVITSLTSTFCCLRFCETCHVGYASRNKYRCSGSCPCCQKSPPCNKVLTAIECFEVNSASGTIR